MSADRRRDLAEVAYNACEDRGPRRAASPTPSEEGRKVAAEPLKILVPKWISHRQTCNRCGIFDMYGNHVGPRPSAVGCVVGDVLRLSMQEETIRVAAALAAKGGAL